MGIIKEITVIAIIIVTIVKQDFRGTSKISYLEAFKTDFEINMGSFIKEETIGFALLGTYSINQIAASALIKNSIIKNY